MFAKIGIALFDPLLTLALWLMVTRVLLQLSHADFYNPISQGIVRLTDAVLRPLRAVLPKTGNVDLASVLGTVAIAAVYVIAFRAIIGAPWPNPFDLITVVLANIARATLSIYWFCLIVVFVMSWVAPGSYHPGAVLVRQLSEPILAPVRRLLPPMGGLDFSMILVFILINVVRTALDAVPSI